MLRKIVLGLAAANLLLVAWTFGGLEERFASDPAARRQPERLERQIAPERVRVVSHDAPTMAGFAPRAASAAATAGVSSAVSASAPAAALAPAVASAPASATSVAGITPAACVEAGPAGGDDYAQLMRDVPSLGVAPGSYADRQRDVPGRWLIYMGPYADAALMQRKTEELGRLKLRPEPASGVPAAMQPGLSLSQHDSYDAAAAQLAQWQVRGLRSARIVQTRAPVSVHELRIERADAARAAQLRAASASAVPARRWRACSTAAG